MAAGSGTQLRVCAVSAAEQHGLGTRTLRGMAWAYSSYVGGRILILVSTAILARLLTPSDFGVVALAITFMALLDGLADLGLGPALVIQPAENLYERAETAFVGSAVIGLFLSLVVAAFSPLVASFFHSPALQPIAAALGANFFLRSLGSTPYAITQKTLNFRARTIAEFVDVFVRGSVGIGLALAGFGPWSLVIGYLVGTIALDATIWWLVDWRPHFKPKLSHLREMLGFGGKISAISVIATLIANIDYVFIGRVLGAASLGLYTLGFRLPELIVLNLSVVAGEVLFPAYSAVDRESLNHALLIAQRYTVMLALPLTVVLVTLAHPIVLGLFGDQWVGSIKAMQILAIYAFMVTVGIPAGTVFKATGRAGVLLTLAIVRLILVVGLIATLVNNGIDAVALVQASVASLAEIASLVLASRLLKISAASFWDSMWPSLVAAALMAGPLFAIERLIEAYWPAMIVGSLTGAAIYIGTMALLSPDSLRYLRTKMFPERPPPPLEADTVVPVSGERIV
jgi:lipopolysaccharide exporter